MEFFASGRALYRLQSRFFASGSALYRLQSHFLPPGVLCIDYKAPFLPPGVLCIDYKAPFLPPGVLCSDYKATFLPLGVLCIDCKAHHRLHPFPYTLYIYTRARERSVLRLNGEYKLDAIAITINISDERYAGGIAGPGPFILVARPACA